MTSSLETALVHATRLDAARDRAAAAALLDEALGDAENAPSMVRFKALLLRAELAVDANDLIAGRGWLAEARTIRLDAAEREVLGNERLRADDLETFLTHRGCAG
jgi:hypothetical protein